MMAPVTEQPKAILERLAGLPFPIYLSADLEPRAVLEAGPTPHRVLICSVPKAGTYLLGGLLARLRMGDSRLHIAATGCSDYRFAERSRALTRPPEVIRAVSSFRVIVAIRDLRDTALSMMRFLLDTGRTSFGPADADWRSIHDPRRQLAAFLETEGVSYLRRFEGLADWQHVPGVHVTRFEVVAGDDGAAAQVAAVTSMAAHVGLALSNEQAEDAIRDVLGSPTLTWSGGRTRREDYWSDEAITIFEQIGGTRANARFGYA
jgi:hypothetical protein